MNNEELDNFLDFGLSRFPRPLAPTQRIELIRTEVDMIGPCCSCKNTGKLTCGRCKAIKYCSQECQKNGSLIERRNGWKDHKDICHKIWKHSEETNVAILALSDEFGGTDGLLQSPLVREGRFKYKDITAEVMGGPPAKANNQYEAYILARMRLIEAYVKCGEKSLSCTAFRLASENMLDLLCLTYSKTDGEHLKYIYCGWMVASGMDQQALNYLCYFQHRLKSPIPLPYLDLAHDEDIEGDLYLQVLKDKDDEHDWSMAMWFHEYMLIALIKYKRIQALIVQRRKSMGSWNSFMMGTHPRAGNASKIMIIRGNTLVIERLKEYVMEEMIIKRINQLNNQIEHNLTVVNEFNPYIIPGLIDRNSIPDKPQFDDEELHDDDEYDEHGDNIHDAGWAFGNYGYAWNMSTSYTRVLKFFLRSGNVTLTGKKLESIPVEGLLQTAFDVDPTRVYDRADDLGLSQPIF